MVCFHGVFGGGKMEGVGALWCMVEGVFCLLPFLVKGLASARERDFS